MRVKYDPVLGAVRAVDVAADVDLTGYVTDAELAEELRRIAPSSPSMTYSSGLLVLITYANGDTKEFAYVGGKLSTITHTMPTRTIVKSLSYNPDGSLASILES